MKLAYVSQRAHGQTGACLTEAAALLEGRVPLMGAVVLPELCPDPTCDMVLRVLPDGPQMRINQNLGPQSKGCRLDAGALEEVVVSVTQHGLGARAMILNKFGKIEAIGRGFVPVIAEALGAGLPVVVGVNAVNLPELLTFAGELAEEIPADPQAIADWVIANA